MPSVPISLAETYITFQGIVHLLLWVVWAVLNLWIWQKTKAHGNLLMLIGSAVLAFVDILGMLGEGTSGWLGTFALVGLTIGFFLSVRPMVEAHLAKLRDKLHHATSGDKPAPGSKGGGGAA